MGTLICYIFPALFFINVMASSSDGKWTAKVYVIAISQKLKYKEFVGANSFH